MTTKSNTKKQTIIFDSLKFQFSKPNDKVDHKVKVESLQHFLQNSSLHTSTAQ